MSWRQALAALLLAIAIMSACSNSQPAFRARGDITVGASVGSR